MEDLTTIYNRDLGVTYKLFSDTTNTDNTYYVIEKEELNTIVSSAVQDASNNAYNTYYHGGVAYGIIYTLIVLGLLKLVRRYFKYKGKNNRV